MRTGEVVDTAVQSGFRQDDFQPTPPLLHIEE